MTARTSLLATLAWTVALLGLTAPAVGGEETAVRNISGRYAVSGGTVDSAGLERKISGIIRIRQKGATFTSHSELKTTDPSTESVAAKVIGTGEGTIEGDRLSGEAVVQLVSSEVPGLGVNFGLAPISVTSRRIHSSFDATITEDGRIRLETTNLPAEGETHYRRTTTTLEGHRLKDEISQID